MILISCFQISSIASSPFAFGWVLGHVGLSGGPGWLLQLVKNQSQILLGNCKGKLSPSLSTVTAERELFIHLRPL